jgi:CRISPR-associated protein Csm4
MMTLYKTTLTPIASFGTSLKGDTLFGQICWTITYKYGEERLNALLKNYETDPFLIVSDGFAKGYLPKPSLPSTLLGENSDEKKSNRKKVWLTLEALQNGEFFKAKREDEIGYQNIPSNVMRNSINYKTFTTGSDGFDPYGENEYRVSPQEIYLLISDVFSIEELNDIFTLLSQTGYGKNTTIGKGRFTVSSFEPVRLHDQSTTYVTLSPFVAQGLKCQQLFYEPFTRFGKHGASLANKNPFKKPLLLADKGSVVVFEKAQPLQYIGKAIKGHSVHEQTVHQGYAITVPIKEITL